MSDGARADAIRQLFATYRMKGEFLEGYIRCTTEHERTYQAAVALLDEYLGKDAVALKQAVMRMHFHGTIVVPVPDDARPTIRPPETQASAYAEAMRRLTPLIAGLPPTGQLGVLRALWDHFNAGLESYSFTVAYNVD